MTDTPAWLPLEVVNSPQMVDTRLQAHHATQALAAFGQSLLDEEPDDSHRSMTWDPVQERFWSPPTTDGTRASLSFEPLELHVVGGNGRSSSLALMGVTFTTLRAWLERAVSEVSGRESVELSWPDYEMPDHPVSSGTPFEPHPRAQRSLVAWYSNGLQLIKTTIDGDEELDDAASPIRVWPHGFDMASLLTLARGEDGAAEETIGVGLSPGDEYYDDPYLYVTVWPHPDRDDLPDFEGPGYWHTKGFVGLVLPAAKLATLDQEAEQEPVARSFMSRAYGLARRMLR